MPAQPLAAVRAELYKRVVAPMALLVSWGLLGGAAWLFPGMTLLDSYSLAFGVLWGLVSLAFLGAWVRGRVTSGGLLLDCGPHSYRIWFLILAAAFLFLGVSGGLSAASVPNELGLEEVLGTTMGHYCLLIASGLLVAQSNPHPARSLFLIAAIQFLILAPMSGHWGAWRSDVFGVVGPAFGVIMAVYCLVMAAARLQVRENGLWQYLRLIPWVSIESHHWLGDSTLQVRAKCGPFLLPEAVSVPAEQRPAIEAALSAHCSVRQPARSNG